MSKEVGERVGEGARGLKMGTGEPHRAPSDALRPEEKALLASAFLARSDR